MKPEEELVRKCYIELLKHAPNKNDLNYFLELIESNSLDESQLINIFKNSREYKALNAVPLDRGNLKVSQWMKRDWNVRAKVDPKMFVGLVEPNEDNFFKNGEISLQRLLSKLPIKIDAKKMRILEIGCGIGRLLIPLSDIFKEVIGVDISEEMLRICKNNINDIKNCNVFQNNGLDLTNFEGGNFDVCLANTVFQHIPEKNVVIEYIHEVERVLVENGIFIFNVYSLEQSNIIKDPPNTNTGVTFSENEIIEIAKKTNFKIINAYYEDVTTYHVIFYKNKNS